MAVHVWGGLDVGGHKAAPWGDVAPLPPGQGGVGGAGRGQGGGVGGGGH